MKFNRFSAFTLGVLVTAVSVSAVTFVNAAGDATLKACANKQTGAMRYISKGACKKTETSLSWNQQGLPGLPGSPGATGAPGTKGETGISGANGQNLYLVDASGQTMGRYLGGYQDAFMFASENRRWVVSPYRVGFWNFSGDVVFYSDAQCNNRLIYINKDDAVPSDATYVEWNSNGDSGPIGNLQKVFVPSASAKMTFASFTNLYSGGRGNGCTLATTQFKSIWDQDFRLITATEISKPTYTAPLSIVAR